MDIKGNKNGFDYEAFRQEAITRISVSLDRGVVKDSHALAQAYNERLTTKLHYAN